MRRPKPVFNTRSPILAGTEMTRKREDQLKMVQNIKLATGMLSDLNNFATAMFDNVMLASTLQSRIKVGLDMGPNI